MKKIFIFLALLSIASTAFAYTPQRFGMNTNTNEHKRATKSLLIGIGSCAIGSGICIGGYTGYMKKYNDRGTVRTGLSQQLSNHQISQEQYDASVSDLDSQNSKDLKKFGHYEMIGGAVFVAGGIFLVDSFIHFHRAKSNITAMASWNGFYLSYRF